MPRKRTQSRKVSERYMDVTTSKQDSMNETNIGLWSLEIEEKLEENCQKLDELLKAQLDKMRVLHDTFLMKLPKEILEANININDETLAQVFMEATAKGDNPTPTNESSVSSQPVTVKKRISKSAEIEFFKPTTVKKSERLRSSSVNAFKTPRNCVRVSTFTTTSKYTVSKPNRPVADSGIHLKRIMKPDEVAISTSGSPLYVHSSGVTAPHVNIPLPGGVVLNIEPKKPRGPIQVPDLDDTTREQLKVICEQLQSLF